MITGELKSKVDRIWDTMWSGGMESLFAGHDNIIDGLVTALGKTVPVVSEASA